ncbi:hypothetical protein [Denitromonas iodatirespirans]|uniref:EfeO-type cupredoxin-like domain-containing protein n=1 Tax=Denitromonas iodatirespirans TaxID=2795389 RepID=A0A944HFC6_DENI1|nr:hypothetical protein [Denitromonas iodatirespirans]MBT0963611.1 hypothetical protein [Denitromonas iodatirespirans]
MKPHTHSITAALLVIGLGAGMAHAAAEPTVVSLRQIGCQFLESENGVDHGYTPKSADDCREINAKTGDQRLAKAKVLRLKPGRTIFRVSNENVPYELGFWVRGDGLANRALLPSASGGGLVTGKTQDYEIDLKPGEYVYSCPLNPTPDYKLVVQ